MKIALLFFSVLFFTLTSCNSSGSAESAEGLKDEIKMKEDSLYSFQVENKKVPEDKQRSLLASLVDFHTLYPEDPYAAECLDKVHMLYSGMGNYKRASQYADLILEKYPKYVNRPMIIESQASNFDIFILPRDSVKVKYYYKLLLKENPKLDKDKKEEILMRLKYVSLNFDEYIAFLTKGHDIR